MCVWCYVSLLIICASPIIMNFGWGSYVFYRVTSYDVFHHSKHGPLSLFQQQGKYYWEALHITIEHPLETNSFPLQSLYFQVEFYQSGVDWILRRRPPVQARVLPTTPPRLVFFNTPCYSMLGLLTQIVENTFRHPLLHPIYFPFHSCRYSTSFHRIVHKGRTKTC